MGNPALLQHQLREVKLQHATVVLVLVWFVLAGALLLVSAADVVLMPYQTLIVHF